MNTIHALAHADLWQLAGWTMLHFLWLGAAAGILAAICRLLLRRASVDVRYSMAVACFALLAALPIGIAALLVAYRSNSLQAVATATSAPIQISDAVTLQPVAPGSAEGKFAQTTDEGSSNQSAPITYPRPSRGLPGATSGAVFDRMFVVVETCAKYLPWLWLAGTPVTFALLASGVVGAERLRRGSRVIDDGPIADACARLVDALGIGRRVTIAVCERIAAPVLVGIVRPIILLPPAALTGWSPDEIEMVLLHELAHVRRWDNLVNLVQRLVESLLFFHPAVWLVSRWVRREREACCDAVVVGRTNRPHAYAEMLVALAAQMPRSVLFHPAATSAMAHGPLRGRIRRILQLEDDPMLVSGKSLVIVTASLLVATTLAVLYLPTRGTAAEDKPTTVETGMTFDAPITTAADALNEFRKQLVVYDLNFDSVFPQRGWTLPDQKRLERYPTRDAWPSVLGHIDTDAKSFQVIDRPAERGFQNTGGGTVFLVPLTWTVGTKPNEYATLLCLKGITSDAHIVAHAYTSFACFGAMGGDVLFESYATALVRGDLTGNISAKVYFDLIVTGKFTGHITAESYAMIYLMGGLEGTMELNNSKVYIAGHTTEEQLKLIKGSGKVYLEGSDLSPGEHKIGELTVTVASSPGNAEDISKLRSMFVVSDDNPLQSKTYKTTPSLRQKLESTLEPLQKDPHGPQVHFSYNISDYEIRIDAPKAAQEQLFAAMIVDKSEDAAGKKSRFPSLEDQKLADVAYRQMGLELEPLTDEQLRVVKARGYDGGLLVARSNYDSMNWNSIHAGDLLVGLHVWPTTSLRDVAEVLNRNDLSELSPLKFYVLRQGIFPHEGRDTEKDPIVTGRITVNSPPKQRQYTSDNPYSAPTLSPNEELVTPASDQSRYNAPSNFVPAGAPTPRPAIPGESPPPIADSYGKVTTVVQPYAMVPQPPQVFSVQAAAVRPMSNPTPPGEGAALSASTIAAADSGAATLDKRVAEFKDRLDTLAKLKGEALANRDQAKDKDQDAFEDANRKLESLQVEFDGLSREYEDTLDQLLNHQRLFQQLSQQGRGRDYSPLDDPYSMAALGKPALRYDGKTFDGWRTTWQTELSTDQRLQAVKALAAFARAGYGSQATEAILDVASEYDFSFLDNSDEGRFKEAVLDVLAPAIHRRSLAKLWLPDLTARYEKDPDKWKWLTLMLLDRTRTDDPETIAILESIAESGPADLRDPAIAVLVHSSPTHDGKVELNDKTRNLLTGALTSGDPARIRAASQLLVNSESGFGGGAAAPKPVLTFQPVLTPLLFDDAEPIRREARWAVHFLREDDVPKVLPQLLAALHDESQQEKRIAAIRALAAIGVPAASAKDDLWPLLKNSDEATVVAATNALLELGNVDLRERSRENPPASDLLRMMVRGVAETLGPERQEEFVQVFTRFAPRIVREANEILPPESVSEYRGGGMF